MQLISIQLLGRWGSATILRFIQDAPLAQLPEAAKAAMLNYSVARLQSDFNPRSGPADREAALVTKKLVDEFKVQLATAKAQVERLSALEAAPKSRKAPRDLVLNLASKCLHRVLMVDEKHLENSVTFCGYLFFSSPCSVMAPEDATEGEACKRCNKVFARYFEPWLAPGSSSSEDGGQ